MEIAEYGLPRLDHMVLQRDSEFLFHFFRPNRKTTSFHTTVKNICTESKLMEGTKEAGRCRRVTPLFN